MLLQRKTIVSTTRRGTFVGRQLPQRFGLECEQVFWIPGVYRFAQRKNLELTPYKASEEVLLKNLDALLMSLIVEKVKLIPNPVS